MHILRFRLGNFGFRVLRFAAFRDKCYAKGVLEDNGWDASQWQPLIENKALASWLVRVRKIGGFGFRVGGLRLPVEVLGRSCTHGKGFWFVSTGKGFKV